MTLPLQHKPKKSINEAIKESEDKLDNFLLSKLAIEDVDEVRDNINEILGLNLILLTLANDRNANKSD